MLGLAAGPALFGMLAHVMGAEAWNVLGWLDLPLCALVIYHRKDVALIATLLSPWDPG